MTNTDIKSSKILLIEDEDFLIKPLEFAFRKEGVECMIAKDGEEGLARVKKDSPDLVLLDLLLPKMNGFEVLKEIKADPATRDIPVLILSNLAREGEMERGLAGGAAGYIVKTNFSMASLIGKVKEILNMASRHPGAKTKDL